MLYINTQKSRKPLKRAHIDIVLRLKIRTKDSDEFYKQLPYAVEKDVWIFNQTTMHATSGLIIHIII